MNSESTQDAVSRAEERVEERHEEEEEQYPDHIKESEPTLMSVKVGGNAFAPNFERPSPFGARPVPGFEQQLKSESFGRPVQKDFVTPRPTADKTDPEKAQGKKANWAVKDGSLEPVPIDFPLEKTSRFISDPASVVANRVSQCLFLRSIDAKFNNSKAIAKCSTLDFVKFRVRLFAPPNREDGPGTIIEVQKRRGDTISFLQDCRAILSAAEGEGVAPATETVPIHITQPVCDMACAKEVEIKQEESTEEILAEAIQSAVDLIRCEEMDLNVLGFESLVALVDPLKTMPGISVEACKILVAHDTKREDASEIRGAIASLLRYGALHKEDTTGSEGETMVSDFNETLKNLSLCLLSKTFATMLQEKCLDEAIQENSEWFVDTLIPPLIEAVGDAEKRPHDALYAAECISSLVTSSKDARRRAEEEDALSALQEAKEYGSLHHSSLANATDGSISLLECSC